MKYLATPNTQEVRDAINRGQLGAMLTPKSWTQLNAEASRRFPVVGLDNGCFADQWDPDHWVSWLLRMEPLKREVIFAVAPDVVGNHAATLDLWDQYAGHIKNVGFPVAFVLQDGCDGKDLPWADIDCLFVGGSTAYKLSETAWELVDRANRLGIWTHMGRVNSFNRMRRAAAAGIQSVDGTYLAYGPDVNLPKLLAWLDWLNHNQVLS